MLTATSGSPFYDSFHCTDKETEACHWSTFTQLFWVAETGSSLSSVTPAPSVWWELGHEGGSALSVNFRSGHFSMLIERWLDEVIKGDNMQGKELRTKVGNGRLRRAAKGRREDRGGDEAGTAEKGNEWSKASSKKVETCFGREWWSHQCCIERSRRKNILRPWDCLLFVDWSG